MLNNNKCTECRYLATKQSLAKSNKIRDIWYCIKWESNLNNLNACNKFKLYKNFQNPVDISTGVIGIGAMIGGIAVGLSTESAALFFGGVCVGLPLFIVGAFRHLTSSDHLKAKKRLERDAK